MPPTDVRAVLAQLEEDPACTVVRTVGTVHPAGAFPRLAAVEMPADRAAALARVPGLHIEPDQPLGRAAVRYDGRAGHAAFHGLGAPDAHELDAPAGTLRTAAVEVGDDAGRPIEGAEVSLYGTAFTAYTGAEGRAELTVPPDVLASVRALVVHPPRACWPVVVNRPLLSVDAPNRVTCLRITETHPDFPDRQLDSWGTRAMGFDRLPPTHRGHGVRIAVIDSGVAAGHPDLSDRIPAGRDVIGQDDKSWEEDLIGGGTHNAVLLAGRDDGSGVVGLTPEAEVYACRIAPEGWTLDLVEALDYCIEQRIDVALIAYGFPEHSPLVAAKIEEARRNGVACVAAAGDSGGALSYPAALPGVLAVGAIGQLGTFPPDGADLVHLDGRPTPEGVFVPRFSAGGPGLDCCAPGLAIVSGLPPTSYGPRGGTGTAAAHVAAVAALVLAHHPLFRPEPGRSQAARDSIRVDRLFAVIRASCRPLPQLDPSRVGAGLPDAAVAVGIAPQGTYAPVAVPYGPMPALVTREDQAAALLEPLHAAMRAAGLAGEEERP
ncbi:S8 family serine peptidase [Planobispora longispora]|nr:S8 family serine peptidase [Planobispora longispora]